MIRAFLLRLFYGRSTVHAMKGDSLPAQIRAIRLSTPPNHKEQTPQVKYAHADGSRLRAKECVAKLRLVYRRRA